MWEYDSDMEVNGIMRKVWRRPSKDFQNESCFAVTFDIGRELPPSPGCGYWTNFDAFKKQFPKFNRTS